MMIMMMNPAEMANHSPIFIKVIQMFLSLREEGNYDDNSAMSAGAVDYADYTSAKE